MSLDPNRPNVPEPFSPVSPEAPGQLSVPTGPVTPSPVSAAPAVQVAPRKQNSGRWLNLVLAVAAAVAIGGVAFAVGRTTAPVSAATTNGRGTFVGGGAFPRGSFVPGASGAPVGGRGGFGGGLGGGLTINGTVESVDGDTLTVKTANGQTVQVMTGPSTTYDTQAPASASDVKAGATVKVQLDVTGGFGRPSASGAPGAPTGTASNITVVP